MVASPCNRNCCLDQHDCCLGCGRFLTEIIEWHQASEERQHEIVELAQARSAERENMQFNRLAEVPFE